MRFLPVVGVAISLFAGVESLTAKIAIILAFVVALQQFHKQIVKPCVGGLVEAIKDLRAMKDTLDEVPGRFDRVDERFAVGDERMKALELHAETTNESLRLIASDERQAVRTAITAAAAQRIPGDRRRHP